MWAQGGPAFSFCFGLVEEEKDDSCCQPNVEALKKTVGLFGILKRFWIRES